MMQQNRESPAWMTRPFSGRTLQQRVSKVWEKAIKEEGQGMFCGIDMEAMKANIEVIKAAATELHQMAEAFPAIARNSARILSSTKMLEISLSDVVDLEAE